MGGENGVHIWNEEEDRRLDPTQSKKNSWKGSSLSKSCFSLILISVMMYKRRQLQERDQTKWVPRNVWPKRLLAFGILMDLISIIQTCCERATLIHNQTGIDWMLPYSQYVLWRRCQRPTYCRRCHLGVSTWSWSATTSSCAPPTPTTTSLFAITNTTSTSRCSSVCAELVFPFSACLCSIGEC